ncbi:DUF58 domain-containing protein [Deinococcus detaillensis]|uniref:DUF58 domain-containing protein n=1 Tax=Deinococcus detaillensis TaxID=2592048 RepID=A0A553V5K7_9DEIO|nr:DUF58 domain-containing protein [Deinococcus detaillensis]TSA87753.1 DUF58 domain-containing protein [Deinococcus detaillensis]
MTQRPASTTPPRPLSSSLRERVSEWASDDGNADTGQGVTIAPATHFSKGPRVYPTRFGAAFLLTALLTLIGCVNYQLSLGYLVTFLMLGLWVVGAVSASRSLSGLTLSAAPPGSAWAGQDAVFAVRVQNPSKQIRSSLRLRAHRPRSAAICLFDVPSEAETRAEVLIFAPKRGPLLLPRLRLEGRDPLGLWRGVTYPLLSAEALVYPAPEEDAPPLPSSKVGEGSGEKRLSGQEDFAGIRPYLPGDAPRQVAWRQSARLGELQTKLFDAPASFTLRLSYSELRGLNTEERLSRLSAWVLQARQQDARYRLELPSLKLEEGSGETQARRALSALALYRAAENVPDQPPAAAHQSTGRKRR